MQLIPGIDFDFGGGRVYTLAAMPLGPLIRLQKRIEALQSAPAMSPETLSTVLQATHASLQVNYPDITEDQVGTLIDVANMLDVISAVLDVGGLKRKAIEEAAPKNQTAQSQTPTGPG